MSNNLVSSNHPYYKYRHLHLWMILPFLLMQSGFIQVYWMNWRSAQWMRHIHSLSAMSWYVLLIIQPYLATRGRMRQHRTLGIIGFFLAGATAFSAISLLPQDVEFGDQGGFGEPFNAAFFYGIVLVELLMMVAFVFAVVMAVLKRKKFEEHALWLITTVFYIMMPGLGRGMYIPMEKWYGPDNHLALSITSVIIILALLIVGWRMKKLKHPAIWIGVFVNLPTFFVYEIGSNPAYIDWIRGFMRYA